MTVCGFSATPNHATIWCDAETYLDDAPSGAMVKMVAAPLACIASVGTGTKAVVERAGDLVGRTLSFDALLADLPAKLAAIVAECRPAIERVARAPMPHQTIGAVGWSHRLGRMMGAVFAESDGFAPVLVTGWSSPNVGHVEADPDSVIAAAHEQMAYVRDKIPAATGRVLLTAIVRPDGITVLPAFDLDRGTVLRRPPMLGVN